MQDFDCFNFSVIRESKKELKTFKTSYASL